MVAVFRASSKIAASSFSTDSWGAFGVLSLLDLAKLDLVRLEVMTFDEFFVTTAAGEGYRLLKLLINRRCLCRQPQFRRCNEWILNE